MAAGDTNPPAYTTGSVTSHDGTTIGYRQVGQGPGVVALHGGMQAAQNLMKLAEALSDAFTVYLPDRRGRGLSGPPGDHYSLKAECEDIDALLGATGAHNTFGLSSGALVALQAALVLPAIHAVALYEPPLSIDHSTPLAWVERFDAEIAEGDLASAMVTAMLGTGSSPPFLGVAPNALLVRLMRHMIDGEVGHLKNGDVPLKALIPTMHCDAQLVVEAEGTLENFKAVRAEVLLIGGSQSAAYLKKALDALNTTLPSARRVELTGVGHLAPDNSGTPERVAQELRRFFS